MRITLITPTGGRQLAFSLCERWMARQTRKWDEWIVVDDCEEPTPCTLGQRVIRPEGKWYPGLCTQHRNLLLALSATAGDGVVMVEDDDWYSPLYVEFMANWLERFSLVGCAGARYYNLERNCYQLMENCGHASLCETAFRKETDTIRIFQKSILLNPRFIDVVFWHKAHRANIRQKLFFNYRLCVGMKGLPGRFGIGTGHSPDPNFRPDIQFETLREWIGEDVDVYREALEHV